MPRLGSGHLLHFVASVCICGCGLNHCKNLSSGCRRVIQARPCAHTHITCSGMVQITCALHAVALAC
eukprot:13304484-Heterocapsa_arctica.AAC.1